VIALAINSGLVAYPVGFTLVWESPGIALWRPIPPKGYVAMGCIATMCNTSPSPTTIIGPATPGGKDTSRGDSGSSRDLQPPNVKEVVVVAQQVVVEATLGECMLLAANGNLWCIQNSVATFEVAPAEGHRPTGLLADLRSPLGMPPAALLTLQQQQQHLQGEEVVVAGGMGPQRGPSLPPSMLAARLFKQARAEKRALVSSAGQVRLKLELLP
jgi:vacuolar protein sorting-associated protein 13A/C